MTPITSLLLFAAWTLLIMFVAVNWRVLEIARGGPANSWTRGSAKAAPAWVGRFEHAHLNCLENLPIFAVIVLAAVATDKATVIAPYCAIVLYLRVAQSLVHMVSISPGMVLLRAGLFTGQILLFFWMFWSLLS
jgi:uncharacterized MAPEG superfamily protein